MNAFSQLKPWNNDQKTIKGTWDNYRKQITCIFKADVWYLESETKKHEAKHFAGSEKEG